MAKTSGLSVRLYAGGYDMSGDVSAINSINDSQALIEVTGLDSSAVERLAGLGDGAVEINGWFNAASGQIHAALLNSGKVRTADVVVLIPLGVTVGDVCAFLVAKESNYGLNRGADGSLAVSSGYQANGFGIAWGLMLTAGKRTDSSAATGSSIDNSSATATGASAVVEVFSLGSGTVTPVVQDSADNSSFSAISGLTFTNVTSAPSAERLATSATATIRQYVRFATTNTFTNAVIACGFKRGQ